MIFKSLTIENFKAIGEPVRIDFKPITLFFGPNSSGKSTILQTLHYAREIFVRQNLNPDRTVIGGKAVDLGGFHTLVHNQDLLRPIVLQFELKISWEDLPRFLPDERADLVDTLITEDLVLPGEFETCSVRVVVKWNESVGQPIIGDYEVGYDGRRLACLNNAGGIPLVSFLDFDHQVFRKEKADEGEEHVTAFRTLAEEIVHPDFMKPSDRTENVVFFAVSEKGDIGLPNFESSFSWAIFRDQGGPDVLEKWDAFEELTSKLILGPGQLVKDLLEEMLYLGPLREVPPRSFCPPLTADESRWPSGLGAWDEIYRGSPDFVSEINQWLSAKPGLDAGYRVEVKEYKELHAGLAASIELGVEERFDDIKNELRALPVRRRLFLREERTDLELEPQDVGIGISQVIPVIVSALIAKSEVVAIEQPELHIHPAMQVELGDVFASRIAGQDGPLFLIETHSEHLILRLLRRIRETGDEELPPTALALHPDDLAVYYFELGDKTARIYPIRIDQTGDFVDRWPQGFFSERVKELYGE